MLELYALVRKELKVYFASPMAYVVLTIFLLIGGYFYYSALTYHINQALTLDERARRMAQLEPVLNLPYLITRDFFSAISSILLFTLPMISMGLFAEEKRRGTIELLLTSPLSPRRLVLGKFAAAAIFFAFLISPTLLYNGALFVFGRPEVMPLVAAYLGLLLLGLAIIAIGMFISSLTESQIIAGAATFGVCFALWVVDLAARRFRAGPSYLFSYLSLVKHYEDFPKGIIDSSHVVFYLSLIALGLFLCTRSVESIRWKS